MAKTAGGAVAKLENTAYAEVVRIRINNYLHDPDYHFIIELKWEDREVFRALYEEELIP